MGLDHVPHPARLEVSGLRLLPGTSTPGQPQASTLLGVEAAEDALVDSELHRPLQASRTSGAAATNLFRPHDIGRARRERKEAPRVHPDAGGVVTPGFASPHRATLAHPVEALLGADPIAEEPNVQVKTSAWRPSSATANGSASAPPKHGARHVPPTEPVAGHG